MSHNALTALAKSLPASVPFVGPVFSKLFHRAQCPAPTEIAMSVFRLQERIESHPSTEVIRKASIHGLEKDSRLKGTSPVHLHCPWSLVLISDSFCVQGETK